MAKQISQTNTQVCLGVKLDENLSWASHIEIIWEKASSGIGMYRALCSNEYFRILQSIFLTCFLRIHLKIGGLVPSQTTLRLFFEAPSLGRQ